jgi:hypothetical protein
MIRVTHHACERFIERVSPCSLDDARLRILESAKAIEAAAAFGCEIVRRGHGERLVLDGLTVLTVYGAHHLPRQCRNRHPLGDGDWL